MNSTDLKANNNIKCTVSSCAHHNGSKSGRNNRYFTKKESRDGFVPSRLSACQRPQLPQLQPLDSSLLSPPLHPMRLRPRLPHFFCINPPPAAHTTPRLTKEVSFP